MRARATKPRSSLASKPRIIAANKIDALDEPDRLKRLTKHAKKLRVPIFPVSAVTGAGMKELIEAMWREVAERTTSAVG